MMGGGGLGMLLPLAGRFGWKGVLIVGAIVLAVQYCPGMMSGGGDGTRAPATTPAEDELVQFTGFVFDDIQASWVDDFERQGERYPMARIVVYRDAVRSGCGTTSSAVGPFYCPTDGKVYIDLSFYQELQRRFGAPGDFAQAYVIAHELGHHIQNVEGRIHSSSNAESVQVELQADCLAGAWARDAERRGLIEPGDIGEAMAAAAAIGDDRIQQQTTGRINQESWTHGSSEQRQAAWRRGYEGGTLAACGIE